MVKAMEITCLYRLKALSLSKELKALSLSKELKDPRLSKGALFLLNP